MTLDNDGILQIEGGVAGRGNSADPSNCRDLNIQYLRPFARIAVSFPPSRLQSPIASSIRYFYSAATVFLIKLLLLHPARPISIIRTGK